MRIKLYEAKWKHIIEGELADNFHNTIDASDVEGAIAASIALLEKCKEFFDPEEDEYVIYEIEDLIESFNDVDRDDVDSVDYLLDELYDFCDGYNIFIGFGESEWNNLEPGVEEEPAPVEEPQEEALSEEKVNESLLGLDLLVTALEKTGLSVEWTDDNKPVYKRKDGSEVPEEEANKLLKDALDELSK